MSANNRVAWSEGLFLRPQHFQQSERFLEHWIEARTRPTQAYAYGFTQLALDEESLKQGKVAIRAAEGIFPDGTPFRIPEDTPPPLPLDVGNDCKDMVVHLALPLRRTGMPEMSLSNSGSVLSRYQCVDCQVSDNIEEIQGSADMKVGQLNIKIALSDDALSAYSTMGIARVIEKRSSNIVALDDRYIPPLLDCRASARLFDFLREISQLTRHRANALADRMGQPGQRGVSEIADFLMLQAVNRYDPLLAHLLNREPLHPEQLYAILLQMAGELATFTHGSRRPAEFTAYRHDDLAATFPPIVSDIRESLSAVLDQNALEIPIEDRGRGLFTASIPDLDLLRNASFILAVNAQLPAETLRHSFQLQVKVGPAEKIRDLVMSHLPGIDLQPLPVAPRQIPYHAGFTYFELDRSSEYWKALEINKLLAMHIAGDFPGLQMEFWGIRS